MGLYFLDAFLLLYLLLPIRGHANPTAILVSGGDTPSSNYVEFFENITKAHSILPQWNKVNLIADGNKDESIPNGVAVTAFKQQIFDQIGRPQLVHYTPKTGMVGPAKIGAIVRQIEKQLKKMDAKEPLFLYFSDHGDKNGCFSLWGEVLCPDQLRSILSGIPSTRPVILVHDHCFSGAMLEAIWDKNRNLRRNVCGFSIASSDEMGFVSDLFMQLAPKIVENKDPAYWKNRDLTGDGYYSFGDIFRAIDLFGMTSSTPVQSSDLFAKKYLEKISRANADWAERNRFSPLINCGQERQNIESLIPRLNATLRNNAQALIKAKLATLETDLQELKLSVGVDFSIDRKKVADAIAQNSREMRAAEAMESAAYDALRDAMISYLKSVVGEKMYADYLYLKKELSAARMKLASEKLSSADEMNTKGYINSLMTRFPSIYREIDRAWASIKPNNLAFSAFVAKHFGPKEQQAVADIGRLESLFRGYPSKMHQRRRLYRTLTTSDALREMARTGDIAAITQYLEMLECEDTPLGKI